MWGGNFLKDTILQEFSSENVSLIDTVRSNVVFVGFDVNGRSKPLPYHRRILSVGVGAHDDPNITKLIFARKSIEIIH